MLYFTRNIETFWPNFNKDFIIVIGTIPNKYGLTLKIFKNYPEIRYSKYLIDERNGKYFSGKYIERKIFNFTYRQMPDKFTWARNITKIKMSIDKQPRDYIKNNYDMTLEELAEFIEKYEPERTI